MFISINTFFITYHLYFAQRLIPGIYVGGVRIGGLSIKDAKTVLTSQTPNPETKIFFGFKNFTYETTLNEISLTYDWDKTIQNAANIGRTGNFGVDFKNKLGGLFGKVVLKPTYTFDEQAFQNFTAKIDGTVNVPKENASFKLDSEGNLSINPEKEGSVIEIKKLKETLRKNFDTLNFKLADIPVTKSIPDITTSDLESVKPKVESILLKEITIEHDEQKYSPSKSQLLKYIKFVRSDSNSELEPKLDLTKVSDITVAANAMVYKSPRGKITKNDKNVVTKFELIEGGEELDKTKFLEDFERALFNSEVENKISLATVEIDKSHDVSKYGIKELIGSGTSTYLGSIPGRETNLLLASERINGALVAPGQLFSFNKTVGDISAKTGYATAYIIQNGRTVLGDGGGVCQTSTTLFRAVLNTGLEVVTRNPHAYRVYYYEQDSAPGFDASIFQPSLDFQFRNDTDNFVLIETTSDTKAKTLTFNFYGTKDGRKVELSKPTLTDQIAPAEALYIDDPTLPKGTTLQTEHATWGAKAAFTRTVTKEDEILHSDTFVSVYQPWRAVFMVGKKD